MTSNTFIILDDEKYFAFFNDEMPQNISFYAFDQERAPDNVKYKKKREISKKGFSLVGAVIERYSTPFIVTTKGPNIAADIYIKCSSQLHCLLKNVMLVINICFGLI